MGTPLYASSCSSEICANGAGRDKPFFTVLWSISCNPCGLRSQQLPINTRRELDGRSLFGFSSSEKATCRGAGGQSGEPLGQVIISYELKKENLTSCHNSNKAVRRFASSMRKITYGLLLMFLPGI